MRLLAQRRPDGLVVPVAIRGDDGLLRPAGEGCSATCCGSCWRPADPCELPFPLPEECQGDAPDPIYVSCQARCEGDGAPGAPIQAGTTFVYNDRCWTVRDETIPFEEIPPGAIILDETVTVECVSGCLDIRCPRDILWIEGTPCDPENTEIPPAIPACSIDRCVVVSVLTPIGGGPAPTGCWKFNPDDAQDIIPARPVSIGPFAERHADCCECLPEAVCPRVTVNNPCTAEQLKCCCSAGDMLELTWSLNLSIEIFTDYKEFLGPGGQQTDYSLETFVEDETTQTFSWHRETTYPGQQDPVVDDGSQDGPSAPPGATQVCPPTPDYADVISRLVGVPNVEGLFVCGTGTSGSVGNEGRTVRTHTLEFDCLVTRYTVTGTFDLVRPPQVPGDWHVERHVTGTAVLTLRRIQPPGPCSNGCGNPGIFRKPPQTLPPFTLPDGMQLGTAARTGGCASCGGGLRGTEV